MPFDGADAPLPDLPDGAPLPLAEFLTLLGRHLPTLQARTDGPDHAGTWWLDLCWQGLTPGVAWTGAAFTIYGPGPTLPERPNAAVADAAAAARRLARMLQSWRVSVRQ
ncbi:hypothetical protein ACFOD4_07625 [Pseudoroseomonas globiformis]|uniref:Uncharacterized protein n=1 Tax=Teichococcus globiformis TaxID=2307229 RepID=A0ABV7FX07_9PROT